MSKNLTTQALNLLRQSTGTDPFVVVGIIWNVLDGIQWYSTRDVGLAGFNNNLMEIGSVRVQKKQDSSSSCGSVSVGFSDTDGALKTVLDQQIIEKAAGGVYLGFRGMSAADLIPLFKGVVIGPAKWGEGNRTVSFDLEMQVESHELGYSATEEDFHDINPEAQGVPWPLMFGTTAHVPALHIRKHTVGHLQCSCRFYMDKPYLVNAAKDDIALPGNPKVLSFLLDEAPEEGILRVEDGDRFPQDRMIKILVDDVVFMGKMHGTRFTVSRSNVPKYSNIKVDRRRGDADKLNYKVLWIRADKNGQYPPIVNHHCYFNGMVGLKGITPDAQAAAIIAAEEAANLAETAEANLEEIKKLDPPDPALEADAQGALDAANEIAALAAQGVSGEWYNKCVKQEGPKCWFRYPFVSPISKKLKLMSGGDTVSEAYGITKNGMWQDIAGKIVNFKIDNHFRRKMAGKDPFGALIKQLNNMKNSNNCWWTAFADDEVRLWNEDDPDIYIASLVQLTEITAVFGKKKVEGGDGKTKTLFQQIPSSYYQIQLQANFPVHSEEPGAPDFYPSGVLFPKALADYDGQNWEDEIYISGTSSVGPNPVEILRWMFSKFTDLRLDEGSFNRAANKVNGLPANFASFDKRNALRAAEEISLQCKCGLIMDSGLVQIQYLAEAPIQAELYTEDQIEMESMDLTFTPTSEVTTKLIGTYTESYRDKQRLTQVHEKKTREFEHVLRSLVKNDRRSQSDTKLIVYRNNITLYGLKPRDESFYIYNDGDIVRNVLDFWGYRFSNSWKLVRVKVPFSGARLQPYDGVTLELTDASYLGSMLVKGEVVEIETDFVNRSCSLLLWLPMKAGSIFVDGGAYPG